MYLILGFGTNDTFSIAMASYFPEYYGVDLVALSFGGTTYYCIHRQLVRRQVVKKINCRTTFLLGSIVIFCVPMSFAISNSLVTIIWLLGLWGSPSAYSCTPPFRTCS
jgi:hypothetical protein